MPWARRCSPSPLVADPAWSPGMRYPGGMTAPLVLSRHIRGRSRQRPAVRRRCGLPAVHRRCGLPAVHRGRESQRSSCACRMPVHVGSGPVRAACRTKRPAAPRPIRGSTQSRSPWHRAPHRSPRFRPPCEPAALLAPRSLWHPVMRL